MRIAFVVLGDIPIPPPGYGGIERVVHEYAKRMPEIVFIRGRKSRVFWNLLRRGRFDAVHVHHERAIPAAKKYCQVLKVPLWATPHMGFVWDRMDADESRRWELLQLAGHSFPMRQDIADRLPAGRWTLIPNGCDTKALRFKPTGNGRGLYLGAINSNKRQHLLADIDLDFIGPIHGEPLPQEANYKGEWTRNQVENQLTVYSALVLWSEYEGGGPPLVVAEALAAGLSLVLSPAAAATLPELPFVHIAKTREDVAAKLPISIAENPRHRAAARAFAEANFGWDQIVRTYQEAIKRVL